MPAVFSKRGVDDGNQKGGGVLFTEMHLLMVKKIRDGQSYVTIKKSIPKIIAALNRIADSCRMVELQEILA